MSRKSQLAKQRSRTLRTTGELIEVQEVVRSELSHFSGPLPEPSDLARYEAVCPGYAKELLEMAKSAQAHSQMMDSKSLELHSEFTRTYQKQFGIGQIIGGILAFSAMVSGTIFAVLGHPVAGGSMIGSVMVALGGAFAWGKWQEKQTGNTTGAPNDTPGDNPPKIEAKDS